MAPASVTLPAAGGCACRTVRYRLLREPLFVHCCHCRWCQRESGSAFALNALVEADAVELLAGMPERIDTPTESGAGQEIFRCAQCRVAVWSHYAGMGAAVNFVRVGTLDSPDAFPPDIHIYTGSRQPWVQLDGQVPAVEEYYRRDDMWPAASLERYQKIVGR